MINKEEKLQEDENIPKDIEIDVKFKHNRIKTFLVLSVICVTVFGSCQYLNKKNVQYGGGFDPAKYMFCAANEERCNKTNYNKFSINFV